MSDIQWQVFIPVGAACIAAGAALWGAWTTNRTQAANRKLAQEMKIADFRQAWLDRLRARLADYLALISVLYQDSDTSTDEQKLQRAQQLLQCLHEILLMLNPNDRDYAELVKEMRALRSELAEGKCEASSSKVVELSQAILKRGWDRIKVDIRTSDERSQ